jgi:putative FmdB family regulatory protein
MPTYEYKCRTCGKEFEMKQSIKADPLEKCPEEICECETKGQGEVFRKISKSVGVVFNGSGFYQTDYVNKPAPAPACACGEGACNN